MNTLYKEFSEVAELDNESLQPLTSSDDEVLRLWAIWALALRAEPTPGFAVSLRQEPNSGVRRALATVLASKGAIELIAALAKYDPCQYVRASVSLMLVRSARAGRISWDVIRERFSDACEVRAAVVSDVRTEDPDDVYEWAISRLQDLDSPVRQAAFEACIRFNRDGRYPDESLRAWLELGIDPRVPWTALRAESQMALHGWIAHGDLSQLCRIAAKGSVALRSFVVLAMPKLIWDTWLPLLDPEVFNAVQHRLHLSMAAVPTRLLLGLADSHADNPIYIAELFSRCSQLTEPSLRAELLLTRSALVERLTNCDDPSYWISDDDEDDGNGAALSHQKWLDSAERSLLVATIGRMTG
jgi:hypothetical protein